MSCSNITWSRACPVKSPTKKVRAAALAAEGAGAQVAFVVAVEGDAEVLHVNQGPAPPTGT